MDVLTWALRGLLFGVLALVFSIGFIVIYSLLHTDAEVGELSVPLVVAGSFVAATVVAFGQPVQNAIKIHRQAATKLGSATAEIRGYIAALEQCRVFAPVAVPGLHLEQGEFAIRHDRATLAEVQTAKVGGGLGTRVRVGGFPIYLGGWKTVPREELREVGPGELVLTNSRLLFIGARILAIPFDQLLTCQQHGAGLVVSDSRSKSPHVFVLETMAGLWGFLVNWTADNRFERPKLPDGMHLRVTGDGPDLHIQVRTDDGDLPQQ